MAGYSEQTDDVIAEIRAEVDDYHTVFPVPYALSHNLALAVRAAALLPTAPLHEEWGVDGIDAGGYDWVADVEFATRLGAENFLASNAWARTDGGRVSRRYFTDWIPVDQSDANEADR